MRKVKGMSYYDSVLTEQAGWIEDEYWFDRIEIEPGGELDELCSNYSTGCMGVDYASIGYVLH